MTTATVKWSEASTLASTGVHHGYRSAPGSIHDVRRHFGELDEETVLSLRKVWWGCLDPGGFILPHIDQGPYFERWHYPIEPAGFVYQNGEFGPAFLEAPSDPFRIYHWEPHAVWNPSDKRRVHLIVELDNKAADGTATSSPLTVFDPLPEMQGLVNAAR